MEKTTQNVNSGQMTVPHTYNPSYSGGKIRRIGAQSQPRQIVPKTLSQEKKKKNTKKGWWSSSRRRP
jgi:hypothetical protein